MDDNGSSYVFISHKCDDHDVVFEIVQELEARGIRCWIDLRDIVPGTDWSDVLQEQLLGAAAVIWVKSPLSATSDQVLEELKTAKRNFLQIVPLQVAAVPRLQPKWEVVAAIQSMSFADPTWADRMARQLLALDGFVATGLAVPGVESTPFIPAAFPATRAATPDSQPTGEHGPFAIVLSDGLFYQLDALNGLGESLVEVGDLFTSGDLGFVAVSSDASVIATSTDATEVDLWTLGAADATRGPVLSDALPAAAGPPHLLAVDRPLGQAIRVIARGTSSAYSLMQLIDGTWAAMMLIDGDQPIVSGAVVKDDVLFVLASGGTVWASNRTKRPFSLPKIQGVDAAVGADGRCYLAGWGSGADGSSLVEVVVEVDSGWERIHRGPGGRAGLVRVMPNVVLQTPGTAQTSLAVEDSERSVAILALP